MPVLHQSRNGKLVRDRIPEIIRSTGREPSVEVLAEDALEAALRSKLLEEAAEAQSAAGREDLLEELADVLEVLRALALVHDATVEDVERIARKKRAERGGFAAGLWLRQD